MSFETSSGNAVPRWHKMLKMSRINKSDISWEGHLSLFVAYVIFGLSAPIAKMAMSADGIDAQSLTFFRVTGACLLFWGASLFLPRERVSKKDLLLLLGASVFGIVLNQMSYITGLSKTSPVDASLIATLGPVVTMLISAAYLKEPISFKKVFGVLTGAAGVILLVLTGKHLLTGESHLVGNLLCLSSSLFFAIYLVVFRDLIRKYSPVTVMKWMFLFATLLCLPVCYNNIRTVDYAALRPATYAQIAYVVVGATFIAYFLLPIGQKRLRPTIVSMYNYIQPLVSAFVAVAMGLDAFGWDKAAATVLIFAGVYIVTQSRARQNA